MLCALRLVRGADRAKIVAARRWNFSPDFPNPKMSLGHVGARMPNGRSGAFVIETADLKRLVTTGADTAVVGLIDGRPASAAEMARRIEECSRDLVAVEEQHEAFYIIHFRDDPIAVWVSVTSESPMFVELRSRHDRWMAEHPGDEWKGLPERSK